jgi:hypothetical protein
MAIGPVLRKGAVWLVAAAGIGPLIAKAIEKWAERNGYLDDPGKGLQWLLTVVSSVTELWFFFPLAAFLLGLAIGLWVDTILKSMSDRKSTEANLLGYDLLGMGQAIDGRRGGFQEWPKCVDDLLPSLQSLFLRLEKANCWTPPVQIMSLDDNGNWLSLYLRLVGRMLADGHYAEAKRAALLGQQRLNELIAKRPAG